MKMTMIGAALAAAATLALAGCVTGVDPETKAALKQTLDSVQELTDLWQERLDELEEGDGEPADPPTVREPDPNPGALSPVPGAALERITRSSNSTVTEARTANGYRFFFDPLTQPTPAAFSFAKIDLPSLGKRLGVSRAYEEKRYSEEDEPQFNYAGWMDHSFFFVYANNIISGKPLRPSESTTSWVLSVGNASGSNPVAGSATWTGIMAGLDERQGATMGDLLEGDATLTIGSFTRPSVGLRFTNITNQRTDARFPSQSWANVPLTAGTFRADGLVGNFYGPGHEEVGGIFNKDEIITGAFGARRE